MIISRYLRKETSYALLGVTFVLLLIFLSNQLVRYLKYAAKGKIAANILLQLMGFEIPFLLGLILPLGVYLGIIFTYGRMYADNELRVLQASGLSTKSLIVITGTLGVFISIFVTILMLWVNPHLASQKNKLILKSMTTENILDTLIPGRFQVTPDDKHVLYVESISRKSRVANNIFIAEQKKHLDEAATWSVISAAKGYQTRNHDTKERYVVALDGYRYEGVPGENAYKIIQFKKYTAPIIESTLELTHQPEEVLPTSTLWQDYSKNPSKAAELQWRISMPIATILLAFLAIPLSYVGPRQNRYVNLFPALLIYLVYMNLLFLSRGWVAHQTLSSSIGLWWVHGLFIFFILGIFLLQFVQLHGIHFFRSVRKLA